MHKPALLRSFSIASLLAVAAGSIAGVSLATPAVAASGYYIALGDSYSSGEGAPPYDAGTAIPADKCHRSASAWPRLLASTLGVQIDHFACSGAVAANITDTPQHQTSPDNRTQDSQITSAVQRGNIPSLATVTIGGNDLQFANILANCYTANCANDGVLADASTILKSTTFESMIRNTYRAIKTALPSTTRLIVVGYPNIFSTNPSNAHSHCRWLTTSEDDGLVALSRELDSRLRRIANSVPGVQYDSTLNVLRGHELCTGKSYINNISVQGGVLGHQEMGHPTVEGQRLLASDVQNYLKTPPPAVGSSSPWAGYALEQGAGPQFVFMNAAWRVPNLACPSTGSADVETWAGVGGAEKATPRSPSYQVVIRESCVNGTIAEVSPWLRAVDANNNVVTMKSPVDAFGSGLTPVNVGDLIVVQAGQGGEAQIADYGQDGVTLKWYDDGTLPNLGVATSAECMVARPNVMTGGSPVPLAKFDPVTFVECDAMNNAPTNWQYKINTPDAQIPYIQTRYALTSATNGGTVTLAQANDPTTGTLEIDYVGP